MTQTEGKFRNERKILIKTVIDSRDIIINILNLRHNFVFHPNFNYTY